MGSITGIPRHYDSSDVIQIFSHQIYFTDKSLIKTTFKIFPTKKEDPPVLQIEGISY